MSVSVAVVGRGHWGRNLVRVFHEIGVLAAVNDARVETANELGAAGAVVTHEAPSQALAAGLPAKRLGGMSPAGEREVFVG